MYNGPYSYREMLVVNDVVVLVSGSQQLRVDNLLGRDNEGFLIVRCSWIGLGGCRISDDFRAVLLQRV
jgi:hypothetical protein